MKFSVVIPTRGDQDLTRILESYDGIADEVLIWDNSKRQDLLVYGRYALIEEARNDLILTQDDDCVVSDPQAIVDAYLARCPEGNSPTLYWYEGVVCNMPPEFRHGFYEEHALVGFGAAFYRDAPARAFNQLWDGLHATPRMQEIIAMVPPRYDKAIAMSREPRFWPLTFLRCCDVAFTALTPRVLVDIPKTNLPWAEDDSRMWKQPTHQAERARMLELVRQIQ